MRSYDVNLRPQARHSLRRRTVRPFWVSRESTTRSSVLPQNGHFIVRRVAFCRASRARFSARSRCFQSQISRQKSDVAPPGTAPLRLRRADRDRLPPHEIPARPDDRRLPLAASRTLFGPDRIVAASDSAVTVLWADWVSAESVRGTFDVPAGLREGLMGERLASSGTFPLKMVRSWA